MCVDTVLSRLQSMTATELCQHTLDAMKYSIADKRSKGWLDDEIVAHMRNMEEINPCMDESRALATMQQVQDQVNSRLLSISQQLKG